MSFEIAPPSQSKKPSGMVERAPSAYMMISPTGLPCLRQLIAIAIKSLLSGARSAQKRVVFYSAGKGKSRNLSSDGVTAPTPNIAVAISLLCASLAAGRGLGQHVPES